jgi:hypothetical protein
MDDLDSADPDSAAVSVSHFLVAFRRKKAA